MGGADALSTVAMARGLTRRNHLNTLLCQLAAGKVEPPRLRRPWVRL